MKYIKQFKLFLESKDIICDKEETISDVISRMKLPKDIKEVAIEHISSFTKNRKGKVFGLRLHKDLLKKISEKNLPSGFNMGVDKNGFFIHTHRARSKSVESPSKITVKQIKFIDSTG